MVSATPSVPADKGSFGNIIIKIEALPILIKAISLSLSAHYLDVLINIKNPHNKPISQCSESVVGIVTGPDTE